MTYNDKYQVLLFKPFTNKLTKICLGVILLYHLDWSQARYSLFNKPQIRNGAIKPRGIQTNKLFISRRNQLPINKAIPPYANKYVLNICERFCFIGISRRILYPIE